MSFQKLVNFALAALMLVATTSQAETPTVELKSNSGGISAVYEVHRNIDFRGFLQQQPSNSVDALIIFESPTVVAILARVMVASSNRALGPNTQFATTFKFRSGLETTQIWKPASTDGKVEFKAIFGLSQDIISANTQLVVQ